MTELKSRQYLIIVLFIQFTSKLVSMPTLVFSDAKNDAILSIMLSGLIELGLIMLLTRAIKNNPNKNLVSLLKEKIGWVSYVIIFILCAFVFIRIAYCLQELYSFFLENLYDELDLLVFIIPLLFVSIFFSIRGLKTMGRTLEIFIGLIAGGMFIAILTNIEFIDFEANLPYLENGTSPLFSASLNSLFLFTTPISLLLLMGKVEITPNLEKKTLLLSMIGYLIIVIFCFIFYSVFGNSMQYVLFALSEYSQFDPYILELQRLIWLSAVIDVTKLFLSSVCLFSFISSQFPKKSKAQLGCIGLLSLLTITMGYVTKFDSILWFNLTKSVLSMVSIGVILLAIIICILLLRRKNG